MKFLKFTLAFLIVITSLIFILPTGNYYVDLLQSFTFHAMIAYLIVSLFFSLMRWKYVAITGFAVTLILGVHLVPHITNFSKVLKSEVYESDESIKVAHFNVLGSNRHFEEIIESSINLDADILSFQEVERSWALKLMDGLENRYPYFAITEHSRNGVAIFSKYPLTNLETYNWTGEPTLTGDIEYNNKEVHFVATHTLSPRNQERFNSRNEHLAKIAKYVQKLDGPVLAIGDFNAVPWNEYIVKIKQTTDLQDSRKGIASTYPAQYPLGIPIDYIFHSDELSCVDFKAIEAVGSDHKGIYGEYSFTSPKMLVDMN